VGKALNKAENYLPMKMKDFLSKYAGIEIGGKCKKIDLERQPGPCELNYTKCSFYSDGICNPKKVLGNDKLKHFEILISEYK
jgi:hypothetical protein